MSKEVTPLPQASDSQYLQKIRNNTLNPEQGVDALAELHVLRSNHADYLTGLIDGIDARLPKCDSVRLELDTKRTAVFAANAMGTFDALDLEGLGLPFVPVAGGDLATPIGIVVTESKLTDRITGMTLLVEGKSGIEKRYLENATAAVRKDGSYAPQWVRAGEMTLYPETIIPHSVSSGMNKDARRSLRVGAADDQQVVSYVIRPKPTATERLLMKQDTETKGKMKKSVKGLGVAAVAGLTLALAPLHLLEQDENVPITTADELVQPAGTTLYDGLKQAEQFADKATLDRTRAAFTAYFSGDKDSLAAQEKNEKYKPNWISQEKFDAIASANNYMELQSAFDKAVDGLPVRLIAATTQASLESLDTDTTYTPASNLADAKALTVAAAQTLNLFDKSQLEHSMKPLDYYIVGSVNDHDGDTEGYFSGSAATDRIVVGENYANDAGPLLTHEYTHDLDDMLNSKLSNEISLLNPDGFKYAGSDWMKSTTTYDGFNNTASKYGAEDAEEDTAEDGSRILAQKPKLVLENSPLTEKMTSLIFDLEAEYPGFTAALLSRAMTQKPPLTIRVINKTVETIDNNHTAILAISLGVLTAVAANKRKKLVLHKTKRQHGVS